MNFQLKSYQRCVNLYIFGILITRQNNLILFSEKLQLYQLLIYAEPSKSIVDTEWLDTLEMPQCVAYQQNVAYHAYGLFLSSKNLTFFLTVTAQQCLAAPLKKPSQSARSLKLYFSLY